MFHDSFENFEITRICMENHGSVTGWQKLFFSYKCVQLSVAVAIATFEIYGWKFSGYLILIFSCANKIFQKRTAFVFTESWSRVQRAYFANAQCWLWGTISVEVILKLFISTRFVHCLVRGLNSEKRLSSLAFSPLYLFLSIGHSFTTVQEFWNEPLGKQEREVRRLQQSCFKSALL